MLLQRQLVISRIKAEFFKRTGGGNDYTKLQGCSNLKCTAVDFPPYSELHDEYKSFICHYTRFFTRQPNIKLLKQKERNLRKRKNIEGK